MLGKQLDLASEAATANAPVQRVQANSAGDAASTSGARKFIGIHFSCCLAYTRVYPNPEKPKQIAHCPRCGRGLEIEFSPNGASGRFHQAG